MQLKSFGCSFIFGTDLADDGKNKAYATVSNLTWPALIAKQLDAAYSCYARPGSGNLRILENILNQSTIIDSGLFVIGWTWIDRFDYTTTDDQWKTILPVDTDKIADHYYRNLHSQYRDKLTTLIHIDMAIRTLQERNIPFVMTYIDELIFETEWHCNAAILELQDRIRPHLLKFEGQTFIDWSKTNNHPISSTMHPLEQAHAHAAQLMMPEVLKVLN